MRNANRIAAFLLTAACLVSACGCEMGSSTYTNGESSETSASGNNEIITDDSGYFTKSDLNADYDSSDAVKITLNDGSTSIDGSGAVYSDGTVKITSGGKYYFTGKLSDGQIYVSVGKEDKVYLIFNGVDITSSTSAAITIESSNKAFITLCSGSTNTFTDAKQYSDGDIANACIYSKDDLTVNGSGTITVNGNFNNGIGSKNDLKIACATLSVDAVNNGLKGNDSVRIYDADITVNSDDDGIKSSNETEADKGFIYIASGDITVSAGDDALQAVTSIKAVSGNLTLNHAGKAFNCDGSVDTSGATLADNKQ